MPPVTDGLSSATHPASSGVGRRERVSQYDFGSASTVGFGVRRSRQRLLVVAREPRPVGVLGFGSAARASFELMSGLSIAGTSRSDC